MSAPQVKIRIESVRSLLIRMRFNETVLSSGTAFVADAPAGPVLVTNRHNVTGRNNLTNEPLSHTGGLPNKIEILHNGPQLGSWVPRVQPLSDGADPLWREHPALGARMDVVALPLTDLDGVQLRTYDVGPEQPKINVGPAEPISVVGFPFGLAAGGLMAIWSTGFVASELDIDFNDLPVFLIDCRSRPGQSGSPVIAHRSGAMVTSGSSLLVGAGPTSRFLGVYSGRINAESDLGFVWKASAINELVQSVG